MITPLSELLEGNVTSQRIFFTNKDLWNNKPDIAVNPSAYQRNFQAEMKWQQLYCASFYNPMIVIPEIALRVGEGIPNGFLAEIMDGCQRISTAFDFKDNKITLPDDVPELKFWEDKNGGVFDLRNKTYSELPMSAKQAFNNYEMAAQVYQDISPERAGFLFVEVLNNTNTLNAQEKRQAISSDMSRTVQQWARLNPLGMFELVGKDLKLIAGAEHKRLDVDKTLAEVVYMLSTDDFLKTGTTGKTIDTFYREQARKYQNKFPKKATVKKVLSFVDQSFRSHSTAKTLALKPWRNYCYFVSKFFNNKIDIDPIEFIKVYMTAIRNQKDKSLIFDGLTGTPYELRMRGNGAEDTRVALELLEDEMNKQNFQKVKRDPQRTFTREQVAEAYDDQGGICAFCHSKMPSFGPDIHGDHILMWKEGNPTTPDNCDALHASCNWRK